MNQRYDNTKWPNPKENQQGFLCILPEISEEGLRSRKEHCWGDFLFMRIHQKRCRIFPLKVATILPT